MPKLNKTTATAVKKAEGGFALVPDGVYDAKLLKVGVSDQPGASGAHYWKVEFVLDGNEKHDGSHQFINLSLSEKALWKMNEFFAAFGVAPDTDTDEMLGSKCKLVIGQATIQSGARAGELGNTILKMKPLEGGDDDGEAPF